MKVLAEIVLLAVAPASLLAAMASVIKLVLQKRLERQMAVAIEQIRYAHVAEIEAVKAQLAAMAAHLQHWESTRFEGMKQLAALGYEARNPARSLTRSREARSLEAAQFTELFNRYDDALTANRLLMRGQTFLALHEVKRQLSLFRTLVNSCTPDGDEPPGQKSLESQWLDIDRAWASAIGILQSQEPSMTLPVVGG